uniref:NADH-ubiquinone oxidoreductase chain 4L n=1 Tax=Prionospio sp. 3 MH-2023 TaxID=3059271 RepID=A0AAU6QGH1_9ANNE
MLSLLSLLFPITLFALISFIMQRQHILMCLLSLEAALLSLAFTAGILSTTLSSMSMFYCVVILTFGACEASLALAILVMVSRSTGSDLIKSINMNKC